MSNRLVLFSGLPSMLDYGAASLHFEEELAAEALAAAITKASAEGWLVGLLRPEDGATATALIDCLSVTKSSCDLNFDLRELITGDEIIAATPRGDELCWGRYRVTIIVPPEPDACHRVPPFSGRHTEGESAPNEDFGDAASEGSHGDTESPD